MAFNPKAIKRISAGGYQIQADHRKRVWTDRRGCPPPARRSWAWPSRPSQKGVSVSEDGRRICDRHVAHQDMCDDQSEGTHLVLAIDEGRNCTVGKQNFGCPSDTASRHFWEAKGHRMAAWRERYVRRLVQAMAIGTWYDLRLLRKGNRQSRVDSARRGHVCQNSPL